jgi:hypothetical protein
MGCDMATKRGEQREQRYDACVVCGTMSLILQNVWGPRGMERWLANTILMMAPKLKHKLLFVVYLYFILQTARNGLHFYSNSKYILPLSFPTLLWTVLTGSFHDSPHLHTFLLMSLHSTSTFKKP